MINFIIGTIVIIIASYFFISNFTR